MSNVCPSAEKCPIFLNTLKNKSMTVKAYKQQYCEAGENGRNTCRRWQCKQKFDKVPENLMPNSIKTLEEIGRENGWQ